MLKTLVSIIIISNYLIAIDPFERSRFSSTNNFFYNERYLISKDPFIGLNELLPNNDSTLYLGYNLKSVISNNFPNTTAGFYLSGNLGSIKYLIEPVLTSHNHKIVEIGFDYSRNNVSASIINAFVKAKFNNFILYFGKFPIFWGKSTNNSIIQSGKFPAYDNILLKFSKFNFSYDLMFGQLNSIINDDNIMINRNISGHRLNFDLAKNLNISFGEHIIYTGENRSIDLTYLNPYVPYFSNGLKKPESHKYIDNDNSIIFLDILYKQSSKLNYYSEFIIDDFQIDETNAPNSIGLKIGVNKIIDYHKSAKLFCNFEYTKINKWTYLHHGEFTAWHNYDYSLGNSYGPDAESLDFKSIFSILNKFDLMLDFGQLVKGQNHIHSKWDPALNNYEMKKYFYSSISIIFIKDWGNLEIGYSTKEYLDSKVLKNVDYLFKPSVYLKLIYNNQSKIHLK